MIELLITIGFVAFIVWLILQIPQVGPFKNIIIGVAVFCVVVILLRAFGFEVPVPRLR